MGVVMILFAFTLSVVINFVEKAVNPANKEDIEMNEARESFVVNEAE